MWQLIPWRKQFAIITVLAFGAAWAIDTAYFWFNNRPAPLLKFASLWLWIVTVVLVSVISAKWRWLWKRFPALGKKFFPDLNGTWEGTLSSTWKDPTTGASPPPIPCTFWIKQTLFSVEIKLRTGESTSNSTRYFLEAFPDAGRFRVWYSYDNQPQAQFAYRSARHDGFAWLEYDADGEPNSLTGQYYTSRKTTGDIALKRTSAK